MLTVGFVLALALPQDLPPAPPPAAPEPSYELRHFNVGYGPFHYTSLAMIPSLRSGFETRFPISLEPGTFDLRLTESWVKNLAVEDDWLIDFEILRSNVTLAWHITEAVHLEIGVESGHRTGGGLDAVILGFHDAFGIAVGNRNQFSRNENRIEIRPPGGEEAVVVDESNPQPYEQAALFTCQYIFSYGTEVLPALSGSLTLRGTLDSGDVDPSGPVDVSASLGLVKEIWPFHLYLGGSYSWFGTEHFYGIKLRSTQWTAVVGLEWNLHPAFSLIGQLHATSGGASGIEELTRAAFEVVAGAKWQFATGVLLEIAIVENVINFSNSPDFGVHGGLSFRF
jgi:hypothetical protein